MIFDQYSRYKASADLLRQTGLSIGDSVLDVGSGPECLFGKFMPDAEMYYVDPLLLPMADQNRIAGDVFSDKLDGRKFNCVSAVDVLEHVPAEYRRQFLERMASLAKDILILGFPASDSTEASLVDAAVDEKYQNIFGHKYSWLEEHYQYGLPSLAETVSQLEALGWYCQTIGHGHAPWLEELLGFMICVWDVPTMQSFAQEISKQFNNTLYPHDFRPPFYRQFVVASRHPLSGLVTPDSTMDNKAADEAFCSLMREAYQRYFSVSLNVLKEHGVREAEQQRKLHEMSEWGASLQALVVERDKCVIELHRHVDELNQTLLSKQSELLKLSDLAAGMEQELKRMKAPLHIKVAERAKAAKQSLRRKLANTILGDLVRHLRDSRHYRANMVSFDVVSKSLQENDGRLIITFPIITWDFRWQRPQHIVSRLRDNGYSVLYLAMSMAPLLRRFRSDKEAGAALQFNNLAPHVNQIWLHSKGAVNIYSDPLDGDDLHNVLSGLRALLGTLQPKSIHYLIQFPGWWQVAQALRQSLGGSIIFDCMDDHGGFSTNTAEALKAEQELIELADLVITSSALLEERCRMLNPKTIQVKNGTEFDHFHDPQPNGELDHLKGSPIIGYYGAISDWFDMTIVAHCARARPQWQFVLIGATFGADLSSIEGLPNVHLLGEKPYTALPGYLAYFDVCTIPFKLVPLTLATNPVKFYEYLSAGKPVVSTDLPELMSYADDCYLARNSVEFLAQLDQALKERHDMKRIASRFDLARANSWDSRVKTILGHTVFR
ncbi:MAG: glycosyltransferase [Betaproteobacteria bacterium]|nr:glycosyltransferase [Betaproteobacteria bacterium]